MLFNRLRKAKRALEKSDECADIAYKSGFSAQSHMRYVFKKYIALSISEYKRNLSLSSSLAKKSKD